jgi:hypothetical protein
MRPSTILIACGVFRPTLEHLGVEERYPGVRSSYLPSNLHLRPQDLKRQLSETITSARQRNERILCLYGTCFPDIEDFCRHQGVTRVPGFHCFEMLLLHDEEMRKSFFEHYERIVYLRQPSDPDLLSKANELATFLQLSLEIRDADYSHLKKILNDLF